MSKAESLFKSDMPRRIDPSSLVDQIIVHSDERPNTLNPNTPITNELRMLLANNNTSLTKDQARAIYNNGKLERFAYLAILDAFAMDEFLLYKEMYPPFGLLTEPKDKFGNVLSIKDSPDYVKLTKFDPNTVYQELQTSANATLIDAYRRTVINFKDGALETLGTATIDNLQTWQNFYQKHMPKTSKDQPDLIENPIGFLHQPFNEDIFVGSETGVQNMVSALAVLPIVAHRECGESGLNPDILTAIAENSFPTIAHLAVLNHHHSSGTEYALYPFGANGEFEPYDPEDFTYKKDQHGLVSLSMRDHVWTRSKELLAQINKPSGETMTIGCPALARVEGEIAMEQLWNWFVDIGSQIYKMHLNRPYGLA